MARRKYTEVEKNLMCDIAFNLKKILGLKGISQKDLADATGLSTSVISDYLAEKTLASPGSIQLIADALNISKSDIDSSMRRSSAKTIPLIGTICAGNGLLADQNVEEYIYYPFQQKQFPDYALRVQGDSMKNAGIETGDIVYLRYAQWADYNGQIVVAIINDDQIGTLKRMKWSEKSPAIQLIPENNEYSIIDVLPSQVRVCGVYMGHFKPAKQD